jgi:hypothetical protein
MPPELRWTTSFSTSCLHAAEAVARGQLITDVRMAEAIAEPAQRLRQSIHAAGLPRTVFWRHLVGLSATIQGSRELALRAATRVVGSAAAERLAPDLAACIAGVEGAVRLALPNLLEELSLRTRPLREHWEAIGPGLLRSVARWSDPELIVPEATVVLVHPSLGGGGAAHLPLNLVHLEAILTHPVPELPESLRLGWLLAQLNLEVPRFSERVRGAHLPVVAELAMLPVTLRAAEDLELLRLNTEVLDLALKTWQIVTPADLDPVDVVWRWWETYLDTRPRWEIALTALDRMLAPTHS